MKKTKKKKSIKPAKENLPSGRIRRHMRIIPWAMVFLVVFYLVSLIAIIQIYPEVFFVSESHAQIKATNLQGMTNLLGTTTTHQTATPKAIETNSTSTDTTSATEAKSILSTSPVQTGTTTTAPIDSSVSATEATDSSNTSTATQMQTSTANTVTSSTTSSTETTNSSKTTNISPELKFSDPADGARIKGQQVFAASVEAAQGVEFYITKKGSLTDNFLCSAKKLSENKWKCEVQTSDIPNGEYELMAKIKNNYGAYKSSAITIKVANETASISSTSANISSATRTSSETNSGDNAASSGGSASQTTKATAQEVQKVQETVEKRSREQNTQNEIAGKATSENATVAGSLSQSIDSDRDGISNEEERRIGTNPYSADTDKDGYLDGDEIKNGFNPLKPSVGGDKIVFESPKEKGGVKKELVQINSVEMVANSAEEAEKNIQLKGKALPLSFVTIYIYSETPTIVTVMTDENGNWTYTMDKSIENGQHEAYVAITDNEGHITAKNEPFFFVKTAEAATKSSAKEATLQNSAATQSPVAASRTKQVAVIGFVIIISLFTMIACIGLFLAYRYHHKKIESVVKKDFLETK